MSQQPGLNSAPAWSPDSSRIALTLSKDGNSEIYTMSRNGTDLRRLTNHPAIDTSPTWSPTGRQIAFCIRSFGVASGLHHGCGGVECPSVDLPGEL